MKRVSHALGELVTAAIDDLKVARAVKDGIEWEVIPYVNQDGSISWLVGIGVKVPATGDWHIPFGVVGDPHDKPLVEATVTALYNSAQGLADEDQRKALAEGNGHKKTKGGLILP